MPNWPIPTNADDAPPLEAWIGEAAATGVWRVTDTTDRANLLTALSAASLDTTIVYVHRDDATAGEELERTLDGGSTWEAVAVTSAPSTFTPSFSNFTLGNGTVQAWESVRNGTRTAHIYITFGSTTALTSSPLTINLGATAISSGLPIGSAYMQDTSSGASGRRFGIIQSTASGTQAFVLTSSSGSYVDQSAPHTWASGDILTITLSYLTA